MGNERRQKMKSMDHGRRGAKYLFGALYVDRVVVSAILARVWPFAAGPITAALILRYFTAEVQGLYYGFFAVVNIQAFFELGFSSLLIGMAGHEAAAMRGETAADPEQARQRLAWLWRGALGWYALTGGIFFAVAAVVGWATFAQQPTSVAWRLPWMVIMPLAAASMWLTPWVAILEGSGYRADVYRYRLYQAVTGNLIVWSVIALGLGIWAAVAATAVQLGWMAYLAMWRFGAFFRSLRIADARSQPRSWLREVVPIQWRLAVQSMALYLATQVFTLIIVAYHGLALAGQLGLTMALATAVQSVALVWVQTRYPVIAAWAAGGRREQIDQLWRGIVVVSAAVLVLGMTAFAAALQLVAWYLPAYAGRFTTPLDVLLLGAGMTANHLVVAQSYYILAHRRQPLFQATMFGLGAIAGAVWLCGWAWGVTGLATAYAVTSWTVYLPLHTRAFVRDRQRIVAGET